MQELIDSSKSFSLPLVFELREFPVSFYFFFPPQVIEGKVALSLSQALKTMPFVLGDQLQHKSEVGNH